MPAWLNAALALVPVVQGVALGLKSVTSAFDPDYRKRAWYKFWNAVAAFPGSVNPVPADPAPVPAAPPKTP